MRAVERRKTFNETTHSGGRRRGGTPPPRPKPGKTRYNSLQLGKNPVQLGKKKNSRIEQKNHLKSLLWVSVSVDSLSGGS